MDNDTKIDLAKVPRRDIRYIMGRFAGGTERAVPVEKRALRDAIEAHFTKDPNFVGWEGFIDQWDIGIAEDDTYTKGTRPEKHRLFNRSPLEIIPLTKGPALPGLDRKLAAQAIAVHEDRAPALTAEEIEELEFAELLEEEERLAAEQALVADNQEEE